MTAQGTNGSGHAGGVAPASGLGQLGAEAEHARTSYGEGALIMCDRLVRIYAAEGIEVQALQGLDLYPLRGVDAHQPVAHNQRALAVGGARVFRLGAQLAEPGRRGDASVGAAACFCRHFLSASLAGGRP